MNKRIAVFSTAWNGEHIGSILRGIWNRAKQTGDDIFIFNTYGGFQTEKEFNKCEYHIFDLAMKADIDGIIILSNSIYSTKKLRETVQRFIDSGLACISVEQDLEGIPFIGTDNYAAMCSMVEHLINVHGCKRMQFVGGPGEHIEAFERKRAFLDTVTKHGIDISECYMGDYNFTHEGGELAFEEYKKLGKGIPDAVVCANDEMALGYVNTAEKYGYTIPNDILVTGFDNLLRAESYNPGITSVERCKDELGRRCLDEVLGMIEGHEYALKEYVPYAINLNESCGCGIVKNRYVKLKKRYSEMLYSNEKIRLQINYMQKNLMTCKSIEEFKEVLSGELKHFDIGNFALLLDEKAYKGEYFGNKYPKHMKIILNSRDPHMEERYVDTEKLLPNNFLDTDQNSHTVIFMPLHQNGRNFGYCVMEDHIRYIEDGNLYYWLSVINVALENIRQNICIRQLNKKLEHLYLFDSMTGIYNRFALQNFGIPLLKQNNKTGRRTLFLFADMDGLKKINDTYGHENGDTAIKALAGIMKGITPDGSFFAIRYGGDEFLMMGTCPDEKMAESIKDMIQNAIDEYNRSNVMPVPLAVSIGYILTPVNDRKSDIDDYIRQADSMMYQIKQRRKKEQKEREEREKTSI